MKKKSKSCEYEWEKQDIGKRAKVKKCKKCGLWKGVDNEEDLENG